MTKIRLGLIGLGYVGRIHLRHSLKLTNANPVAAADLSKKARREARNAGVKKTFNNYEQLLKEPNIDAVIIALPTHLHLQCTKQAAENGKHVFLEKPIARNVREGKEIIATAKRNSVKLMVGYPLRFNPPFRNLKKDIISGILGDIENTYATFVGSGPFFHRAEAHAPVPVPEWWFNKELTGGGVLIDLGSHMINILRWYFGEVKDIKSHLGYRFNMDFEDSSLCMAKFESGTRAVINVGWFSQDHCVKVELFGSVKHAIAQHKPSNPLSTMAQMLTAGRARFYWPHFSELQYFIDCLNNDLSPSPSGEDGLRDLQVIARAYRNQIRLD